ncbi:MAG: PD-(D/E)XK nuclease family transposase [Clostridia bacterium]
MNEKINQWLAFIDDNNKELVNMAENKNETLKKAREEMNYLTGDAELRRLAELREKWEMDRISAISHATKIGK